jgi:AP-2 complex subunit beta-1
MYWRLLSTDPETAKKIVMGPKPPITAESEKLDPVTLEELCLNVGTLATIYLKPVQQVFRTARPRKLAESPALVRRKTEMKTALDQAQAFSGPVAGGGDGISSEQEQTNRVNKAAADAADEYFNGLGRERMSLMSLGGGGGPGDMLTSPTVGAAQQGFGSQAGGRDLLD